MTPDADDIVLDACPPHEAAHGLLETDIARVLDDYPLDGLARAEELARHGSLSPAYVAAEYAAAGQPLDEFAHAALYRMGQNELLDEIVWLADYQG